MPLSDLYQEVMMDHYANPRNRGTLAEADASWELHNPTCGDVIRVDVQLEPSGDQDHKRAESRIVRDIRFSGHGCSISQASASMMTQLVKGKTLGEALALVSRFLSMMKGEAVDTEELGDAQALQGVTRYPVRVKCATLAWHVMERCMGMMVKGEGEHGDGSEGSEPA